jgi:hypothetical protein
MASKTITSADSSFVLSSSDFALIATSITGYAADAAFAFDEVVTAEMIQGVDGISSAGWLPRLYPQTIHLQADSDSRSVFDLIVATQDAAKTVYRLGGVITIPGLGMSYVLGRGVLTGYPPMAAVNKTLAPAEYKITWESVLPLPIS